MTCRMTGDGFAPSAHGRDIYASFHDDDLDAAISNALAPEPTADVVEDVSSPCPRRMPTHEVAPAAELYAGGARTSLDASFLGNPTIDAEPLVQPVVAGAHRGIACRRSL